MSRGSDQPINLDAGVTASTRTWKSVIAGAIALGVAIGGIYWQLGEMRTTGSETRNEVKEIRTVIENKAEETERKLIREAYVSCLEMERTNKKSGWQCPMAKPVNEEIKTPRRVATKRHEPKAEPSSWNPWATPVMAKEK